MKELRITKGEWKYRDHFSDGIIETEETIIGHLMKWGSPEDELQANALLIADAGNTAQKCGLLPSELLQQRDELREALAEQKRLYFNLFDEDVSCMYCEVKLKRGSAIILCKECAESTEV